MKLWIRFNFACNVNTQIRVHKILRSKISEWQGSLIDGCVLTYHFRYPPSVADSLYACFNVVSMNPSPCRTTYLSESQRNAIPTEIRDTIAGLASQYLVNPKSDLQVIDYELDIQNSDTQRMYESSVTEVLNFASKGTEIALEVLKDARTKNQTWKNDKEIAVNIIKLINECLATQIERNNGLHFVCNSLGLWNLEPYIHGIVNNTIPPDSRALAQLYQIENLRSVFKTRWIRILGHVKTRL